MVQLSSLCHQTSPLVRKLEDKNHPDIHAIQGWVNELHTKVGCVKKMHVIILGWVQESIDSQFVAQGTEELHNKGSSYRN